MGKRCFSKCRKVKEGDCVYPCSYIPKGYCRLASSLKMVPPGCEIVAKGTTFAKGTKVNRSKVSNTLSKKTRTKRLTKTAKVKNGRLCIDGLCVLDSLRTFFKQSTFDYEVSRTSDRIEYQRGHYKAYATFQKGTLDSYLIGKGLRPYFKKVPNFLDTFGIKGKSRDCLKEVTLLTESLPGKTLRQIHRPHFYIYDALYVFYQIYAALTLVPFTHGSLTCDHVLVYELPGYLEYHYPQCSFQSKYLVKLTNYRNSTLEGVKRCAPASGASDLELLKDYARVSQMKPHANKYIQGFVDAFQATTVTDAEHRFRELIQDPVRQKVNQKSQSGDKLGELRVYGDQPMVFRT